MRMAILNGTMMNAPGVERKYNNMPYKPGDYIKDKAVGYFRRILSVHDDVVDISYAWNRKNVLACDNNGLRDEQKHSTPYTLDQLNAYFVPVTAEEAGFEEEKPVVLKGVTGLRWRPADGEKYWFIDSDGSSLWQYWRGEEADEWRYRTGNCFKTSEDAEKYYEDIMKD